MRENKKFEEVGIADDEIDKLSEREMNNRIGAENTDVKSLRNKNYLENFVNREYFEEFVSEINRSDEETIREAGKIIDVDIFRMRDFIRNKIPELLERVDDVENRKINIVFDNSLRDVLGNSITSIFDRIVFVLKNFKSEDPGIRNKINNSNSYTRNVIKIYSGEGEKMASYYINSLCDDDVKLAMELTKKGGYLEKFSEYFEKIKMNGNVSTYYPTGAKKLPYFRFFGEMEKWKRGNESKINNDNFEEELEKLKEKDERGNKIIDKEKIRGDFLMKEK